MRTLYIICLLFLSVSCSNFLDVKPMGKLIPTEVEEYENLLNNVQTVNSYFLASNSSYLACLADNLKISGLSAAHYFDPGTSAISNYTSYTFQAPYYEPNTTDFFWENGYKAMGIFNTVIDGVSDVQTEQTSELARQLIAQAKAARAWFYLSMSMIYGPVYNPAGNNDVKTIPYRTNSQPLVANPERATTAEVFKHGGNSTRQGTTWPASPTFRSWWNKANWNCCLRNPPVPWSRSKQRTAGRTRSWSTRSGAGTVGRSSPVWSTPGGAAATSKKAGTDRKAAWK